jgi:hypothetical protein
LNLYLIIRLKVKGNHYPFQKEKKNITAREAQQANLNEQER